MWSRAVPVSEDPDISINVTEWSRRGFPCVLLHGFGDAGCVWTHLASRLAPQFHVLAVDLRGHGGSDRDPRQRYDTSVFADDLGKAIASFALERVILIGHSLGAGVAIRYAAANPDRVAALVIIDFGPELTQAGVDEVMRAFAETPRSFASTEQYAQWLIERRPFGDPKLLRQFARCTLRQTLEGTWEPKADPMLDVALLLDRFVAKDARYCDPQMWLELDRIKCPVLIVRGMGSGVFPYDMPARMAERLRAAQATIAGAGHSVMLDNPLETAACVAGFLAGVPFAASPRPA